MPLDWQRLRTLGLPSVPHRRRRRFTAVAEASADSVADGACVGSAVGRLNRDGEVQWLRPLRDGPKVEGIDLRADAEGLDLRADAEGLTVCLVTDADDPDQASCLLLARP